MDVAVLDPMGRKDTVRPLVARKSDDVWYVEYTPLTEGLHSVNIYFAGKAIPNSPYPVGVARGEHCWNRPLAFLKLLDNIYLYIYIILFNPFATSVSL